MNIVAIDPSFRNMAFVFAEYKELHTDNTTDPLNLEVTGYHLEQTTDPESGGKREKDWAAAKQLATVVKQFTEDADIVFIEQPVGSQSARSAWTLGITLGLLAHIKPQVITLSAREVKKSFTGNAGADKLDMISQAQKVFSYVQLPKYRGKINYGKAEHIADALGVLYTGVRKKQFREILNDGLDRSIHSV